MGGFWRGGGGGSAGRGAVIRIPVTSRSCRSHVPVMSHSRPWMRAGHGSITSRCSRSRLGHVLRFPCWPGRRGGQRLGPSRPRPVRDSEAARRAGRLCPSRRGRDAGGERARNRTRTEWVSGLGWTTWSARSGTRSGFMSFRKTFRFYQICCIAMVVIYFLVFKTSWLSAAKR